ncbi:hypothetical protein [Candidatus Nitrospira bockiana]
MDVLRRMRVSLLLLALLLVPVLGAGPPPGGNQPDVVTGILEQLDLTSSKGTIRTDLGKPIFFEVAKPELFKGLTVGERVTIQLDDQGRAIKVMDVPAPELKQPLP